MASRYLKDEIVTTAAHLQALCMHFAEVLPPDYPNAQAVARVAGRLAGWMSQHVQSLPPRDDGRHDPRVLGTGPYAPQVIMAPKAVAENALRFHQLQEILQQILAQGPELTLHQLGLSWEDEASVDKAKTLEPPARLLLDTLRDLQGQYP